MRLGGGLVPLPLKALTGKEMGALVSELLPMPSKQPDYREHRAHTEFLMNMNVPTEKVKAALKQAWKAEEPLKSPPLEKIAALARDKYATREWNHKF